MDKYILQTSNGYTTAVLKRERCEKEVATKKNIRKPGTGGHS